MFGYSLTGRTAVYGPVCTVVWEGWSREASPYPDFVVLALFMRLKLAFWVAVGIPISFLGALALMPALDVTINMISLLAFILVLGIVVDDAIVIAENIDRKQAELKQGLAGAIEGTREVCVPVVFGVVTTMVAFCPMFFLIP